MQRLYRMPVEVLEEFDNDFLVIFNRHIYIHIIGSQGRRESW
jgi:hypothetical protein